MKNLTLIGIVGRDAQIGYFKPRIDATVTTFWISTPDPSGSGDLRKRHATWHKVAVYGDLQKLAITIEKGDLVSVSGPIHTQSPSGLNGDAQRYCLHAHSLHVLRRNNPRNPEALPEQAVATLFQLLPFQLRLALRP